MIRYIVGALVVAGVFGYFAAAGSYAVAIAMVLVPIFAWYVSRILIHGGFELWHYARHGSKAEWNGRHYEFAGMRLRAEEIDDGLVFVEEDLLAIIAQPQSRTVELFGPAERVMLADAKLMALTQAGCERLLLKCPHRDAKKLMLFLQREAFFPHARRHGRFEARVGEGKAKTTTTEEGP